MPKPRHNQRRKLWPVMHIFCEGQKTEPNYLKGYLNKFHAGNRLLQIEKTNKNTPVQLVEDAIKLKNSNATPNIDSFWVVYDRESKAKYTDQLHQKALDLAKSNNINLCLTNVCFEVWLLLHFTYSTAAYQSCDDLLNNSSLRTELRRYGINTYNKADENIFDIIADMVPAARANAVMMNKFILESSYTTEDKPHLLNPYTKMHSLLDAIDEFSTKHKALQ